MAPDGLLVLLFHRLVPERGNIQSVAVVWRNVIVKSAVAAAADLFNALIIRQYVSRSLESPVCTSVTMRNQG